jgi:linoleoyl-CoA desaturase
MMEKLKFAKSKIQDDFYSELRRLVYQDIGAGRKSWGPNKQFWFTALFWFALCWILYTAIILGIIKEPLLLPACLIVFLSGLLLAFSVGHDASHQVISKYIFINRIVHFISFITVGIDPSLWGLRHIRSHHLYPNVEGSDIDIDKNPLLRLSPTHPWKRMHRFQHLYAPFAYSIALIHSVLWGDWIYLFHRDYNWMRKGCTQFYLWTSFLTFKILHFTLMLFLPWYLLPYSFWQILLVYLFCGVIVSLVFIIMLVGTHFFEDAEFLEVPKNSFLEHTWAIHNLKTSCDWNPKSAFSRFISGGANCHAAHHLFPNVCHIHYGKITKLVDESTKKFNICYHQMSLSQMIVSHFRHLKKMGEQPFNN